MEKNSKYSKPYKYEHEITSDETDSFICKNCGQWFWVWDLKKNLCQECRKNVKRTNKS